MNPRPRKRHKAIVIIILIIFLAGALDVVIRASRSAPATSPSSASEASEQSQQDGVAQSENVQLSKNVERKNDAQRLASSVDNFMNNNIGDFPTQWQDGQLTGANDAYPERTEFKVYKSVDIIAGPQEALTSDGIRVVLRAKCGQKGAAVAADSSRGYAVQYSQLVDSSGAFAGECFDGSLSTQ